MDVWQDVTRNGEQAIQDLCTNRQMEGQQLEFKTKKISKNSGLHGDDKKNLGKSLSAFSNAIGGVLIWGVATSSGADDEAQADQPVPISDIAAFARKVESLVSVYLSPPNMDVEVLPIASSAANADGYLAMRIGTSDHRPHMSLAQGHNTYFLRVGGMSLPMADFQVRDMLRINSTPQLSLGYLFRPRSSSGTLHRPQLVLTIANDSDISAHHSSLQVLETSGLKGGTAASDSFETFQQVDPSTLGVHAIERCVVHPGQELPAIAYEIELQATPDSEIEVRLSKGEAFRVWHEHPPIHIRVAIGCEDSRARGVELVISPGELETAAEAVVHARRYYRGSSRL